MASTRACLILLMCAALVACSKKRSRGDAEPDMGLDADAADGETEDLPVADPEAEDATVLDPDAPADAAEAADPTDPDLAHDASDTSDPADEPEQDGPGDVEEAHDVPDASLDPGDEEPSEDVDLDEGSSSACLGLPDFTTCTLVTTPDRDYDICIGGRCRSPGCGRAECNPPGPHFPVPDTNLRRCYNYGFEITCPGTPGDPSCGSVSFCGQDAQYGWDTTHASTARYTRAVPVAGEPVVTDTVTGLEWQGCEAGLSGSNCLSGTSATRTWASALAYCEALGWGGHADWRLPDGHELLSIVDYSGSVPMIDAAAFPQTSATRFWTLTTDPASSSFALAAFFDTGRVLGGIHKTMHPSRTRCVRGGPFTAVDRFTRSTAVSGEPVVVDNVTGLEWQGCVSNRTGNDCSGGITVVGRWGSAINYCEALSWGGYSDWTLPNIKEIDSIVDHRLGTPAYDPVAFPATPSELAFSSTSSNNHGSWDYVFIAADTPTVADVDKTTRYPIRCVRHP
jgi:hypothetical protein